MKRFGEAQIASMGQGDSFCVRTHPETYLTASFIDRSRMVLWPLTRAGEFEIAPSALMQV